MSFLKSVFTLSIFTFLCLPLFGQLADINEGCSTLEVRFTAPSGSSFFWDFGDGSSSIQRNPVHNFDEGTWTVNFRNTDGGTIIASEVINVYAKPTIDFIGNPQSGCVPLTTILTSTSVINSNINVTAFNWQFGDGTNGTGNPATHVYDDIGSYRVALQVVSDLPNCTVRAGKDDFITTSTLDASFSADDLSACAPPLTVNFTNDTPDPNSDLVYAWDLGNGNTSSDRTPPAQTYTQDGAYPVSLTVTDADGCSSTSSTIVNIGSPLVSFNINDTICSGETTMVNTSSNGTYFWNFGLQAIPSTSTERNPVVRFNNKQDYNITLTVTDPDGCSSDTTIMVHVDMVFADFTSDPTFACQLPATFTYTPSDPTIDSLIWIYDDLTQTYDETGTFIVPGDTSTYGVNGQRIISTTLSVLNARGCSDFFNKIDTVHAPNSLFTVDTTMGCAPLTVTFYDSLSTSASGIVSYTYVWGDGAQDTYTNTDPVTHTYMASGDYLPYLIIENGAGCLDTSYAIPIYVGESVMVDFTADQTEICPGDSVNFMGTGDMRIDAWHFDAEGGRLSHCADNANPLWTFESMTGTMDVELTVLYNGCATKVSKTDFITVNGPIAEIDYLIDCASPFDVLFEDISMAATDRKWYLGNGDSTTLLNPTITYPEGEYQVVLEAMNSTSGCPASYDTVTVSVQEIKAEFPPLEETYCIGDMIDLDGTMSNGVNADCWKGYRWTPSDNPFAPITTQDSIIKYQWTGRDTQFLELIVEDINGCRDTMRDTTVIIETIADFSFGPNPICTPNDVTFTDMSTSDTTIISWSWMFGDGDSSMNQNVTHTYGEGQEFSLPDTNFEVILMIEDETGCMSETSQTVEIYTPKIFLEVPNDRFCVGDIVEFSADDQTMQGSFLTYEWFLNDVPLNITSNSGTAVLNQAGTFELKVEFIEDATGCKAVRTKDIFVQDYPDANFTSNLDANPINCAGPIVFDAVDQDNPDVAANGYIWNPGDGAANINNPRTFSYDYERGTYTVSLTTITTFGCETTESRDYTFVSPEGTLTESDKGVCLGEDVSFTVSDLVDVESFRLDLGDGTVVTDNNNYTHTFSAPGTYRVRLIMEQDLAGAPCTAEEIVEIVVDEVDATFEIPKTTYCPGEPIAFNILDPNINTTDYEILWDFGNGQTSNDLNPIYTGYTQVGTQTVTLTVRSRASNCIGTFGANIEISLDGDFGLSILGDTLLCNTVSSSTLTVTSNVGNVDDWAISWTENGNSIPDMVSTITVTPPYGTYAVTVVQPDGCQDSESIVVSLLNDIPAPDSSIQTAASNLKDFNIRSLHSELDDPRFTVSWSPTTNLDVTDPLNPVLLNGWEGDMVTYKATVSDSEGCYFGVFQRIVRLIEVPNIFTPNSDMRNDNFDIIGDFEQDDILSFRVFNRWGQMVYNNETPSTGWDGRFNDEPQPVDVYVYKIEVKSGDGVEELVGDVTLLR